MRFATCSIAVLMLVMPSQGHVVSAQLPSEIPPYSDKIPDGARLRLGTIKLRHSGEISDLVLAPDGSFMITMRHNVLYRWNMETGFIEQSHKHDLKGRDLQAVLSGAPSSCERPLALSDDGKMLAYQLGDRIWLIPSDLKSPPAFSGAENGVNANVRAICFKDNSHKLVFLDSQNVVWDASIRNKDISRASTALKGNHFALTPAHCAISSDDGFAVLFNWRNKTRLHQFAEKGIVNIAFCPGGRYLALATYKEGILIWDTDENKELTRYKREGNLASRVAITPEGIAC